MARLSPERVVFVALLASVAALALWQFSWLGTGWDTPIPHGPGEDWDWQLTPLEAARQAVHEGSLPLWNPYTGGGAPLLGNPETPALYPGLLLVLGFWAEAGLKLMMAAHLVLLVVGFGLAGRELRLSPLASQLPALFLLCSAFLPGFVGWGHVMFLPIGYLPLAWVALRRRRGGLAGLMLGLCGLAGGHYLLLYGLIWLALDALLRSLEEHRLRWLALPLVLNGLLLGQAWAAWPLAALLALGLGLQRWGRWKHTLGPLLVALLVTGLLTAPRLVALWPALEASARLSAQQLHEIADPYTLSQAFEVLAGRLERPSGHEGQNVFWSPWPLLLGGAGLLVAVWRRPSWALLGLVFWNLGWAGATPLNLMDGLGLLPGYGSLRVVERFALIWTPMLGLGAGLLLDRARRQHRALGLVVVVLLATWLHDAAPRAAQLQRFGPGIEAPAEATGPVVSQRGPQQRSNFHSARLHEGRLDHQDALDLAVPEALRAAGEEGYRGEAWLLETGRPVEVIDSGTASVTLRLDRPGTVVLGRRALGGWPGGEHLGLVAVPLEAGERTVSYRPRGLGLALGLALIGLLIGLVRSRTPPAPLA